MIDRKKFFDGVRAHPFNGNLTQGQVDGLNSIVDEWEHRKYTDLRQLAYILATTKWETANTMQPIAEYGLGRGHPYGVALNGHAYYGRGYVQLTWAANYSAMGKILGIDLVGKPELALDPKVAADVMFEGMMRGTFTGKKLSDCFNDKVTDWVNARKIINGLDHAYDIAAIAKAFYADLTLASSPA